LLKIFENFSLSKFLLLKKLGNFSYEPLRCSKNSYGLSLQLPHDGVALLTVYRRP